MSSVITSKKGVPPRTEENNEGEVVGLGKNYWHASALVWAYVGEKMRLEMSWSWRRV
jgi:hypothetical protein